MPWLPNPLVPGEWEWHSPSRAGEDAFNLKDVSEEHPDVFDPSEFFGKEDVAATIRIRRTVDRRTGEADTREKVIFFDGGEDEEEFWDNYHEAVRDAISESYEDYAEDYDIDVDEEYDDASVAVVAIGR